MGLMMGDGMAERAGRGGVSRRLPACGLVVAAVALFACVGGVLAACPHVGARVISGGAPDLLVGAVLYVRFGIAAHSASELLVVEDPTPVPIPVDRALFATVLSLAPRLVALWAGLAVAWWMEAAARREARAPVAMGADAGVACLAAFAVTCARERGERR